MMAGGTGKPTFTCNKADNPKPAAYLRVSTQRQGQSGLGLEAQRSAIVALIGDVEFIEFIEVESGTKASRPQLQAALAHCRKSKAQLVIAKLDRLARNVHFISGLMESGVDFVAADMPQADRFMLRIFAAMAEEEGRRISERTKAALQAAKLRGVQLGRHGKVLARKNKEGAERFARQVYLQMVAHGIEPDGSLQSTANALNRAGVISRTGGHWYPTSVARLLARLDIDRSLSR
ncbi:recombinase family protein [Qipengyuania pelagi]|nr:recombinase family protein [Qipengyuania pelagi]